MHFTRFYSLYDLYVSRSGGFVVIRPHTAPSSTLGRSYGGENCKGDLTLRQSSAVFVLVPATLADWQIYFLVVGRVGCEENSRRKTIVIVAVDPS